MSLYILATGSLIADPQRRTSASGKDFATATVKASTDDGSVLVSLIVFGTLAEELLRHHQGSALAVSGPARLTSWIGKDGAEKHGLSLLAEQIASAAAARRAEAERRRERQQHTDALDESRP
jgi:single-stranded DNA-binding protein